ncbi:FHA domain-containing protein [Amnibacterium setariae]|uniref:FHA domain-containing protein n=1 Tax=Amnibacterium setariae TaxID=2306585 RepID=A0A3A1U2S6_9MICO|nr:FHA domain-containing protein [Amnibacterium setariae]RIX28786.1 FHA domain-containing protein [Amnibacterium setariae]
MGWLWLGLVLGLLVGAGAVALVVRAVGKVTGTSARSVGRLIVDGLTPGRPRDGVAAQRALARRLRGVGERTAAGRRVAAEELEVHVGPEAHESIADALGVEAAEEDLTAFYRDLTSQGGWIVGAPPQVRLVRDISLRPRQAFVRSSRRPASAAPGRAPHRPVVAAPDQVLTRRDDALTDVLPRGLADDAGPFATAVYPAATGVPGDLVVVHGTDVRTVPAATGVVRMGRGGHNDLVLDRPGVGRDHLVVEVRGDAWWIVPGTGETVLDGAPLDVPRPVMGGEVLELGRGVRVRLSVEAA